MQAELVSRSHHIDQDEPDTSDVVAWMYEYDLLTLRATSGLEVTARTYTDTPGEVSLLRFTLRGQQVGPEDVKKSYVDSVTAFRSLLREQGFDSVTWLGGSGYVDVPHLRLQRTNGGIRSSVDAVARRSRQMSAFRRSPHEV